MFFFNTHNPFLPHNFGTNQGLMIFACAQPLGTSWSCLLGSTRTLPTKNKYSAQTKVSQFLHAHNPWVRADPASWDQLVPCPQKINIRHKPRSHNFCMRTTHGLGFFHSWDFLHRSRRSQIGGVFSQLGFFYNWDRGVLSQLRPTPPISALSDGGSIFTVGIFSWVFSTREFFLSRCDLETVLIIFDLDQFQ